MTVVDVKWSGTVAVELTYKDPSGRPSCELLCRDREPTLKVVNAGRPWSFDGDGARFRLVSEAHRIRLAYLFDPLLAVHTSLVDPLPRQITGVYGEMLPRQPLRYLLADDPGAGKTIMTGLLTKELLVWGDMQRCMIVCPGNLVEQWQDELDRRFHLAFEIMTNDKLESARTGNWFAENPLVICRLASSPEAIYQSLRRRRERLQKRLREEQLLKRGADVRVELMPGVPAYTPDDLDELDDAPDAEVEVAEEEVMDQATAARTIKELEIEIGMLRELEDLAHRVRHSGTDRKWDELSKLLQNNSEMFDTQGHRRKLVVFTEHRDTLNYLADRIGSLLGRPEVLVTIHGSMGREERRKAQEAFTQDKTVEILGV